MTRTSLVAAKNFEVRADDYSSSSSAVTIKSYPTSSTYDFYIPSKNPKYLNGTSGDLEVANQTLVFDVQAQQFVWSQASSASLFLQGQTTALGSDEHGNVMTILKEERVVAGDPQYDPSKSESEQVFKATYQFTDKMYNMSELTAGKKNLSTATSKSLSSITAAGTTATVTLATGHGLVDGDSVTISGANGFFTDLNLSNVAISNVTATTFEYTLPAALSNDGTITDSQAPDLEVSWGATVGVAHDKTTGLYFAYADGVEPAGSTDLKKQALDSLILQTKKTTSGSDHTKITLQPLKTEIVTKDQSDQAKSTVTLEQTTHEIEFADSAKFSVDNKVKKISTDMTAFEFGPSDQKHRLSISGEKLFIQKWNSTTSTWVGADVVIDTTVHFTGTISISATNTIAGLIDVTATLGGTYDHWHVKLDDGSESMAMTGTTFQIDASSTYIGEHTVVAYAADENHNRISEYAIFTITTTM